jgi:hypothetical protein
MLNFSGKPYIISSMCWILPFWLTCDAFK